MAIWEKAFSGKLVHSFPFATDQWDTLYSPQITPWCGGPVMPSTQNHHQWLQEMMAGLVAASGVGYVATSYTVSRWLTRCAPAQPSEWPCARGMEWEPLSLSTKDHVKIEGWVVSPPNPVATVMLFHGLRANRMQTLERLATFVDAGFRCVAIDHRAHGLSSGTATSFGFHESLDVAAVHDYVSTQWPHQPKIAFGISMGAAAICFAANHGVAFDAIILEGMYDDLYNAFFTRIGSDFPFWFRHFIGGVIWVTERRLGLRIRDLAPIHHVHKHEDASVLLLTGSDDPYATPDVVRSIYEEFNGTKEMFVVPNAGHEDVDEVGGPLYRQRMVEFLQRCLPRQRMAA